MGALGMADQWGDAVGFQCVQRPRLQHKHMPRQDDIRGGAECKLPSFTGNGKS